MKTRIFMAIAGMTTLLCGWAMTGFCDDTRHHMLSLIYSDIVEEYIEKCEARARWLDSDNTILREAALRAKVECTYLQANRNILVKYLAEKVVPLNLHAVGSQLNRKFADSGHATDVFAERTDEPDG